VLGTDKIADAVKELNIRLNEGGDGVKDAFGAIGLNFDEVATSVSSGQSEWGDYFGAITAGLQSIEDPIARQAAAVALFGTQAEDLGPQFVDSLNPALTTLTDMAGATEALNAQYNTMGDALEGMNRRALVAIEPVGDALLELTNSAMPFLDDFLTRAEPIIAKFAATFKDVLPPAMAIVGDSLARIGTVLGVTTEGATGMDVALKVLEGTLNLIVTAVEAVAVGFAKVADAFEIAKGLGDQLGTINDLLGQTVGGAAGEGLFGSQGVLNPFKGAPSFAGGGIVPGTLGEPVPIIAHGGEVITDPRSGGGGAVLNISNITVNGIDDANAMFSNWLNMLTAKMETA
jgi:hypothetical protein